MLHYRSSASEEAKLKTCSIQQVHHVHHPFVLPESISISDVSRLMDWPSATLSARHETGPRGRRFTWTAHEKWCDSDLAETQGGCQACGPHEVQTCGLFKESQHAGVHAFSCARQCGALLDQWVGSSFLVHQKESTNPTRPIRPSKW